MFTKTKEKKSPLEIVQEIHTAVLTASDKQLNNCKKVIDSVPAAELEQYSLMEKMKGLGFGNIKEIKENDKAMAERKLAFERSQLILDYLVRYPDYKFICTEDMDDICKKYNLVLAADKQYIGSMPVRSMKRITEFKLQERDEIFYRGDVKIFEQGIQKSKGTIEWKEIPKSEYMSQTAEGTKLVHNGNRIHYIGNKDYFTIGAPISMFDIEGMKQVGTKLVEVVEVDDPFCLKTVRYGYLVLAVWGEELAIAKLQNATHN